MENVLLEHPEINEAVCIGVPAKHFGEVAKAFVVLKKGSSTTPAEIIDFCRTRLIKYKVPRHVELRSELPKSAHSKILRYNLVIEERQKLLADLRQQLQKAPPYGSIFLRIRQPSSQNFCQVLILLLVLLQELYDF